MKKLIALIALALPLAAPLAAQEGFDFKTLDKLGANAKNRTNVTLDGDMLKLASGFLGGNKDTESAKTLVDSLKGVYIRSWEFDKKNQYNEADLDPLRAYLKQFKWNRVVESREDGEISEIYLLPEAGGKLGGVAIISAEPKEVTVVYINGSMKPDDINKLSGSMGIPDLSSLSGIKGFDKTPPPAKKEKEED
ncbi:MAG TPA: DUF4252 domain-containing protein [Bryobacteraceae bacterium]|nr:DUF4252 domain-containing protein [Bryobacteraceae bacterium]